MGETRPAPTPPFAGRLKSLRAAAGLTQADLAERAGLHVGAVFKIEQGRREPAWTTVLALAKALGVSLRGVHPDRHPRGAPAAPPRPARLARGRRARPRGGAPPGHGEGRHMPWTPKPRARSSTPCSITHDDEMLDALADLAEEQDEWGDDGLGEPGSPAVEASRRGSGPPARDPGDVQGHAAGGRVKEVGAGALARRRPVEGGPASVNTRTRRTEVRQAADPHVPAELPVVAPDLPVQPGLPALLRADRVARPARHRRRAALPRRRPRRRHRDARLHRRRAVPVPRVPGRR